MKQDESGIGIVGKLSGRDSAMLFGQRTNQLRFIRVLSFNLDTDPKISTKVESMRTVLVKPGVLRGYTCHLHC